jgi:hypothetical protein
MVIPQSVVERIERKLTKYCEKKVPITIRNKVSLHYKIKGNSIFLYEKRPHYLLKDKILEEPVAKIKYLPNSKEWQLFYQDRNLRWHEYWDLGPEKAISKLIEEIDEDPTCIFWG